MENGLIAMFELGTLGAGNHYGEVQVVDEIYDEYAASKMGIDRVGQVCVMIHCGSRGLGHQVATDSLVVMEKAMKRDKINVNDRQLACARIKSAEGRFHFVREPLNFIRRSILLSKHYT
ncbi:unnamed protein product [Gongylonema pulchrum]|uniref:3'-phosphate/5'-hydroxy nucleic acid ligase n=1 Tax=Gongylonema pulchrum TaxID=637853 RepID=A0A183DH26_9BILA|nr:unnamed protein product [Gongylonema pulchrum]